MANDLEFARFRQQLGTRPQRQQLGIDMDQKTALRLLHDRAALHAEYQAWRTRKGLPPEPAPPTQELATIAEDDTLPRRRSVWARLLGR